MNTSTNSIGKIKSLQGLRTIAFLMVFLLHTGLTDTGEIGVSIFFVLSGFVMFLRYQNEDLDTSVKGLFKFSINKISKLYTLHVMTMLFVLYFEFRLLFENFETVWHLILNLLLLQVWSPNQATYMSLNGVCWFYAVCLFLYLLFPLINKGIKDYKGPKKAVVAIVVTISLMAISSMIVTKINVPASISNNFIKWFTYIFPVYRLGDFFIGCNLAFLYKHLEDKIRLNVCVSSIIEIISFAALFTVFKLRQYGIFVFGNNFVRYNLVYLPVSMLIVFVIAYGKGIISKLLATRPLVFIGDITSFAFLIHTVVIKYYFEFFHASKLAVNPLFSTLTILVVTILLSYLYSLISKMKKKVS